MLYFSKISLRSKHPENALFFLNEINMKKEMDVNFKMAYWTAFAQASEELYQFHEAILAYEKMADLSETQGMKAFANMQIERLTYLENN